MNWLLSTFRADVTPPVGAPLCGGRVLPVKGVDDPLSAVGVVLHGPVEPIVLCAVDWCIIRHADHDHWRARLAAAAGTDPDRVAVQMVHQHDAPQSDIVAYELIAQYPDIPPHMDPTAWEAILDRLGNAVAVSMDQARPVDHVRIGQAKVEQVGATRRPLGPDGRVVGVRYSACRDEALRALSEGLIDPWLKTIAFWDGETKRAALHYYAVHPMSHYGQGMVSTDFCGLARDQVAAEDGVPHIYFTGCAGDVTAGKYNDGSPENREVLTRRMAAAMRASEEDTAAVPLDEVEWRVDKTPLPPREELDETALLALLADTFQPASARSSAANQISWLRRASDETPLFFSALHIGDRVSILHLPGEMLIAYQVYAQERRPEAFVAVAAYGDGGPSYIPPANAYDKGGYEVDVALVSPAAERVVKGTIKRLLAR